jgi:hypothetical protein
VPNVRSPAPILLEGAAGERAFGLFVVENKLPQEISTRMEVGQLVDPDGREIKFALRFEPGVITLAPTQQVVAKVSMHISRGFVAGVRYRGEIRIPGITGARIPIIVRRKPSGNPKAADSLADRASIPRRKPRTHRRGQRAQHEHKA